LVEHYLDTVGVIGSSPIPRTIPSLIQIDGKQHDPAPYAVQFSRYKFSKETKSVTNPIAKFSVQNPTEIS